MHQASSIPDALSQLADRLASIESRLDSIEVRMHGPAVSQAALTVSGSSSPPSVSSAAREMLLAPPDEQIINLIRARGAVCAEEVRVKFGYKGKNAASARLSRLFELGLLDKQQAGRVVYYKMK